MAGSKQKGLFLPFILVLLIAPAFAAPVLGGDSAFIEEGRQLYTKLCSGCHGDVGDSAKAGRSMTRIRSAIRVQPSHRPLSTLSDEDILLIAMALREGEE